jgi:hypothetical protein
MSTSVENLQQAKEDYSQAKVDAESALLDLERAREQYNTAESNLAIAAIPPITRSILTQRTSELASARLQVAEKEIVYTAAQANELAKKIVFNVAEKTYQLEQLKELEIPDENIEIPVVLTQTVSIPIIGSRTFTLPTGQTVSVPLPMLALASTGTGLDVVPEAVTTALNTVGILPEEGSVSGPGGTFSKGNSIAANVVATNQITAPSITTSGSVTADNLVTNIIVPTVPLTGTVTVAGGLTVTGNLAVTPYTLTAALKAFDIPHPTKENMRLKHGSLEGPEAAVYTRGKTSEGIIPLPDYWAGLVDEKTITVHLTPTNMDQTLVVNNVNGLTIQVLGNHRMPYYYYVMAERKDIDKLQVEYDA